LRLYTVKEEIDILVKGIDSKRALIPILAHDPQG
jgi:hypothetical protein